MGEKSGSIVRRGRVAVQPLSLDWAQRVLFPEAEAGKRFVISLGSASYWDLEVGKRYGQSLFAPLAARSGFLQHNKDNEQLVELVKAML